MPEKADLLRRAYEAFHAGEFERAIKGLAEEIRWQMPSTDGLPATGVFQGRDEVRWMFERIHAGFGDGMNARPVEYLEADDAVVALGNLEGSPNGNYFRVPYSTVWRFNEEGLPCRALTIFDTAVVRDALEREPTPPPPGYTRT